MKRSLVLLAAVAAASSLALSAQAQPQGVKAGVLTCNVGDAWGFVFGSSRHLHCTFTSPDNRVEEYAGEIQSFGVDIGYHAGGVMVWAVFAPGAVARGALEGHYGGVSGGGAVGVGAAANVLVGGSEHNISLQPVSIEGETGLNLAAGVTALDLHPRHRM
jgi:hypothetical protein